MWILIRIQTVKHDKERGNVYMKNNEIEVNVNFLVNELHKEWERTGKTKITLDFTSKEADEIGKRVGYFIHKVSGMLKNDSIYTFEDCMGLSKASYIYLRMYKKIVSANEKAMKRDKELFRVELDDEEYKVLIELMEECR